MSPNKHIVLLVETSDKEYIRFKEAMGEQYLIIAFKTWDEAFQWLESVNFQVDAIITSLIYPHHMVLRILQLIRTKYSTTQLPFIIYASNKMDKHLEEAQRLGANDFYFSPLNYEDVKLRVDSLIKLKQQLKKNHLNKLKTKIRPRFIKRGFDVLSSGFALLLLSPILLMVMAAIRLESKGPIFYTSKRVGAGYRVFKLFKFRTMAINADKMIDKFKHLNSYDEGAVKLADKHSCEECALKNGTYCAPLLYQDGQLMCEKGFQHKKEDKSGTFLKIKNDPRITKVGRFLRNTSLDELPQLINIFRGDMSLVGNRPLPLYEAEKLTTDEALQRFLAPAGLTGLWQVTKRGKSDMSVEERIALDNQYAQNQSLFMDIKIILKTFPALFQHDNV